MVSWFCWQTASYGINGDNWAYQEFVADIKREVKPNETIFMEDLSGRLSVVSQRTFVSGDGLVNSNRYLHHFLAGGLVNDYLHWNNINYFLTSNIQCPPYRKVMPWTRTIDLTNGRYRFVVDLSYLTRLPLKPSSIDLPAENLRFDKCSNGLRLLLFALPSG